MQDLRVIGLIENLDLSFDRFSGIWASGRSCEVEIQSMLAGESDECPLVDKPLVVAATQMVEHHPPSSAEARRHLEQFD